MLLCICLPASTATKAASMLRCRKATVAAATAEIAVPFAAAVVSKEAQNCCTSGKQAQQTS
jgi:hypothetical protein